MTIYKNGVAQGASNVSYTELDGSVNTTADALGLGDDEWGAWDLSGSIPEGTKEVDIMVEKLAANDFVGCRKNGSALARRQRALKAQILTFPIEVGADRIVAIMSGDVSDKDVFSLMGYWS